MTSRNHASFIFKKGVHSEPVLILKGKLGVHQVPKLITTVNDELNRHIVTSLSIDLGDVTFIDDYGVVLLVELKKRFGEVKLINPGPEIKDILALTGYTSDEIPLEPPQKKEIPFFVRLGGLTLFVLDDIKRMIQFVGDVVLASIELVLHPKSLRWDDTIVYMQRVGVDALPIVGLISFLLGLIMAFMSSVQLEQFGANIYVASLVALSMTRELGPIMTAIIVAGRSGSAFASEIGSMKINEEVDALSTMGFNTTKFLVMPKLVATVIVVPILTLFSDIFAIFGGLIVGVGMLDLTASAYMTQTITTLTLFDINWGFFKSAVFALLIAWIGCYRGFQVRGGANSVGQATTSAVVSGIFLIILYDSIFAVILRYWNG